MSAPEGDMTYTRLGSTSPEISRICLGCMSYGEPGRGTHPWSLDEESSRPFFAQALDLGINFFDTANVYSLGTSEEYLGRALTSLTSRDRVVIATDRLGVLAYPGVATGGAGAGGDAASASVFFAASPEAGSAAPAFGAAPAPAPPPD